MSMISEHASGLRERKKRATCNSIERAAVHLALEQGHLRVTVREICERAEVSRSTFFNYMPTREAAIFGRPIPLAVAEDVEALLAHSIDVPLTTALLRILFLSVGHSLVNPEVAAGRLRLGREQPDAEPLVAGPVTGLMYELSGFLAGWLERHPERRGLSALPTEREASYLVLLTGAAFRTVLTEMAGSDDTEISEAAFEAAIDEIVTLASNRRHYETRIEPQ